ncbi:MAG: aminopeptidase N [Endozoicomonas sp. (ex Botrylloides leachii)]|nr:aminopeptidase N [Endozoicomonas sp. (ex Botrylloides leachii)]
MKESQPKPIFLKDYQAPEYWIDKTELTFELYEDETLVTAKLHMHKNEHTQGLPKLTLLGIDIELISISLDGRQLDASEYQINKDKLILSIECSSFTVEIKNRIKPQENTSLEGLYKSNGMFCTQCEAEGFRKISYYLDRPDVMSVFSTKIIADKTRYPILLANGNDIERGDLSDNRHWVKWVDPFKKPSYLFALVAGDLQYNQDHFVTMSGRKVELKIFTEAHNIDKCDHAMASLKKAMKWDEEVYGREYDLDIFMIVAVDHFNMGAMENKGLNIFNSSCVLASPETATDNRYQRVEGVVAHEYFHNWSGNRVTCRDWFQLSLKEGFTVFRDSEFSADMNSRGVKRIEDATVLRTAQFAEDAGPMAHPIRPKSFIEISNFYTVTIYEKGAEVVRMIHTLLGAENFRKGSDLYFDRHDGQAVTCEDFIKAMEDASGYDLTQFRRWYDQAGTPVLNVTDHFDLTSSQYELTIEQNCPPTPDQTTKEPFHIPVRLSLLDQTGQPLSLNPQNETEIILELKKAKETFIFEGIAAKPLPSILRGFSAPVHLNYDYSREDMVFLMQHDTDSFNRWDAMQRLFMNEVNGLVESYKNSQPKELDPLLISAFGKIITDESLDMAVKAEMLSLPSTAAIAAQSNVIHPELIHDVRQKLRQAIARAHQTKLLSLWTELSQEKAYKPQANDIAERKLKNTCLSYLIVLENLQYLELADGQYQKSTNMTDRLSALSCIVNAVYQQPELIQRRLMDFQQHYQNDANSMDQWFSVQASSAKMGTLEHIKTLMQHEKFDATSPNKARSLVGSFTQNMVQFHKNDGSGYHFLAGLIIEYDRKNPQLASRLMQPLTRWKKFEPICQEQMKIALEMIRKTPDLSTDVFEVLTKSM